MKDRVRKGVFLIIFLLVCFLLGISVFIILENFTPLLTLPPNPNNLFDVRRIVGLPAFLGILVALVTFGGIAALYLLCTLFYS